MKPICGFEPKLCKCDAKMGM